MIYLFKETWKYAGEDRWKVVLFMILHAVSNCGLLLQPYAFGKAINSIQINGLENVSETTRWFLIYISGFFVFQIFHHSARYFEVATAHRSRNRFINTMYEIVSKLPMKWHVDNHTGETVNRIIVAGDAIRDVGFSYYGYLEKIFLAIGPLIILLGISPEITVICLVLMGANMFVAEKLNKLIAPILSKINESAHEYTGKFIDFIGNIRTVITLNIMNDTKKDLNFKFNSYYRNVISEFRINQPRCFLIGFGSIFTQMTIIIFYLFKCKYSGEMIMIGTFTIIINYFNDMSDSFFSIVSNFYEILGWKTNIKSVDRLIEEYKKGKCHRDEEIKELREWNKFEIRDLYFGYNEYTGVLTGINLDIKKGDKIAVVGASGSGKSTLINILGGLYKPDEYSVWVDKVEKCSLNTISKKSLYVSQEVEIFDNTLEYNITFGMKYSQGELDKAVRVAQLEQLLSTLPDGIRTNIREKGLNFSGGEKQRLALARGLFFSRNKEILLLDEITSNVDVTNERNIFMNIFKNYKEKTVLANVHSLNILDMFDRVIVLEDGKILQEGTFEELSGKNGRFKELWTEYLLSIKY